MTRDVCSKTVRDLLGNLSYYPRVISNLLSYIKQNMGVIDKVVNFLFQFKYKIHKCSFWELVGTFSGSRTCLLCVETNDRGPADRLALDAQLSHVFTGESSWSNYIAIHELGLRRRGGAFSASSCSYSSESHSMNCDTSIFVEIHA